MKLTPEQLRELAEMIEATRENELDCNECLDRLAAVAEQVLGGLPLSEIDAAVRHHLAICPECRDEFEELLRVLGNGDATTRTSS